MENMLQLYTAAFAASFLPGRDSVAVEYPYGKSICLFI
jgi:hypothetical protein